MYSFARKDEGFALARKMLQQFSLNETYSFAFTSAPALDKTEIEQHNASLQSAIGYLDEHLPNLAILQDGEDMTGQPSTICYVMEKGKFTGMACVEKNAALINWETCKKAVTPYPDYDFIRTALLNYAERNPEQVRQF